MGAGGARAARAARRRDRGAARRLRPGAASASASSTPTSGSRTCSSTAAHVRVIDFDDCGFPGSCTTSRPRSRSWRTTRACPSCARRGSRATARSRRSTAADEAELDTFVMLRRLLLVAWIGSHHTFATEAAELGAGFTAGTCALAERYLSNPRLRRSAQVFTPVTGRTVLVTGGTKGIGKGIAGVFARAGANVVVIGRDARRSARPRRDSGSGGAVAYVAGGRRQGGRLRADGGRGGRSASAASTSCAPTPACSPTPSSRT